MQGGEIASVWVQRSGGFAGVTQTKEVSAAMLPASDAATLRSLVFDRSGFFTTRSSMAAGADRMTFVITVKLTSGQAHTVQTNQIEQAPGLAELVRFVFEQGHNA